MADYTIDSRKLLVWVHTWHGRDDLRGPTIASLDASDAAGRYEVLRQPEGYPRDDFFLNALQHMAERPDIDWTLRLEDDVIVNKHLVHNVCRWRAPVHRLFGAGWLSVTNQMLDDTAHISRQGDFRCREYMACHFAGGVLMSTKLLGQLMPRIEERMRKPGSFAPGVSISSAVWKAGRRVFFHEPSLVKIDGTVPPYHSGKQTMYNTQGWHARWAQPFHPTWRTA